MQIPLRRDPAEMGTIGLLVTLVVAVFATVYIHRPSYLLFPMYKQFWMIVSLVRSTRSGALRCPSRAHAPHAHAHTRADYFTGFSFCDNSMRKRTGAAASVERRRREPVRAISPE